jgi:hypothetical protein
VQLYPTSDPPPPPVATGTIISWHFRGTLRFGRMDYILAAHEIFLGEDLSANGIFILMAWHGMACLVTITRLGLGNCIYRELESLIQTLHLVPSTT